VYYIRTLVAVAYHQSSVWPIAFCIEKLEKEEIYRNDTKRETGKRERRREEREKERKRES